MLIMVKSIDNVIRRYPDCGVMLIGDFNKLNDSFIATHYRYKQVVNKATRQSAILDKIWTNMYELYDTPSIIEHLGKSDHNMVLWAPSCSPTYHPGSLQQVGTRMMGHQEKVFLAMALPLLQGLRWESLYRIESCHDQFQYFQSTMNTLIERSLSYKTATRHSNNKPWVHWMTLTLFSALTSRCPTNFYYPLKKLRRALDNFKTNKATGPDEILAWILRDFASILSKPLVAIFNSSLREGVLPDMWKSANILPLLKAHPPRSIASDLHPISLTPIMAKVVETVVMKKWVNEKIADIIDENQFRGIPGTSTLIGMTHHWYQATDDSKLSSEYY